MLRKILTVIFVQVNKFFKKLGYNVVRVSPHDDINFQFDCNFPPYSVEYEASSEKIQELLYHIEAVWNKYGESETYWSVLTSDDFLRKNLSEGSIEAFYDTGKDVLVQIENTLRRCGEWDTLNRKRCMEYGCGAGRVTVWLANEFEDVTALDISQGHIELARQRIDTLGVKNIDFQKISSLDYLASLPKYDFIFSVIVLQHNPPPVIAMLIEHFFRLLKDGGVAMFQVPVQIAGYGFSIDEYIAGMNRRKTMEMHMLPQSAIFEIARRNNCRPLEAHNDNWTGSPTKYISQTLVFKKYNSQ